MKTSLPLLGKATSKKSACTIMITGSNAVGKAIPPHFQCATFAQCQENEQCRLEAAAFFPGVWCKFGRKGSNYIGVSVGLNKKGGMDGAKFEKYIRNCILLLFLDALDLPGFCVMIKVDSSPGRLNVNLLAKLHLLGYYLYPGMPNTTSVTQETDRNYGPFKSWFRFRANLGEIIDAPIAAKKSVLLQPWLVGLILFGKMDKETGFEIKKMRLQGRLFKGGMLECVGEGWCSSLYAKVPVGSKG